MTHNQSLLVESYYENVKVTKKPIFELKQTNLLHERFEIYDIFFLTGKSHVETSTWSYWKNFKRTFLGVSLIDGQLKAHYRFSRRKNDEWANETNDKSVLEETEREILGRKTSAAVS